MNSVLVLIWHEYKIDAKRITLKRKKTHLTPFKLMGNMKSVGGS